MPKMKTNRGAKKRFKITATGKLKRRKARRNHILSKKTTKQKRGLRKPGLVDSANEKSILRSLPYG
jgi:large subunit ribosomal protein L35